VVILDVERGAYYGLEEVGARVWALLQEPRMVSEVRDAIVAEFEVSKETCEQDLLAFLGHLADTGLIDSEPPNVAQTRQDDTG
jgi:hypothetical protein